MKPEKPEPRLSVSHSITRTGKLEVHTNGMPKPKVQRVAPGYNRWMNMIDMFNNFRR